MAQLNITLNQEEILQLLCDDRSEAFRLLLENNLNSILKAESAEQLRADPYERSDERRDARNGFRDRDLVTRIGKITLHVPRHRNIPFKTMIFDNYSRSEAALLACMTEMVINGVSTRKVAKVVEEICGKAYSKSTASELCKDLDKQVEAFRKRALGRYPFVTVDATYFKVREEHRVISKAFMIAYGVNEDGTREILGFSVKDKESKENWKEFFCELKSRGLTGILMITSDAHEGIKYGISQVFPDVPWQRCQFHFLRDILENIPKKYEKGITDELHEMFTSKTIEEARKRCKEIIDEYIDVAEKAMNCLDEGFEDSMTVMELPGHLRKYFRTSNHIERLNKELKRRSKVIGIFPNKDSLLRLMGAVLIERHEQMQARKKIYSRKTYEEMTRTELPAKLIAIAAIQMQEAA